MRLILLMVFLGLAGPGAAQADAFLLGQSSYRYLDADDLFGLSKDELWVARNEILARHGYAFSTARAQAYFGAKDWYEPVGTDVTLSRIEEVNVAYIKFWEDSGECSEENFADSLCFNSLAERDHCAALTENRNLTCDGVLRVAATVLRGPDDRFSSLGPVAAGEPVIVEQRLGDWLRVQPLGSATEAFSAGNANGMWLPRDVVEIRGAWSP